MWQKSYGGSQEDAFKDVVETFDEGYLLSGYTFSNDEDVSGNHGNADYWVVKVDKSGAIQWQKCYGGSGEDMGFSLRSTSDKNFIVTGHTFSSDGQVFFKNGGSDVWNIQIDHKGALLWQKCIGTNKDDYGVGTLEINKNQYVGSGFSNGVLLRWSNMAALFYKLGKANTVKGSVFFDKNVNGIKDSDETYFDKVLVKSQKQNNTVASAPFNGSFYNDVDTGTYITNVLIDNSYFNVTPSDKFSSFSDYFKTDSVSFAIQPVVNRKDLTITVFLLNGSRPGFPISYKIVYQNIGTQEILDGTVLFIKDRRLSLISTSPQYSYINDDTIQWRYSQLLPYDTSSIQINFTVARPPVANIADTLASLVIVNPVVGDKTPSNNMAIARERLRGSYDPNDKEESHGGQIARQQIIDSNYLTYTIRFQNTGNDTAFNVVVRDTLSDKLDWNTLEMVTASHGYKLNIENNKCIWCLNNILLPDSNVNEPASHGYIVYRIKPKRTLTAGDVINNTASIYFDFNLPVLTNTSRTVVEEKVLPVKLTGFRAQHYGKLNKLDWVTAQEINSSNFEIERSIDGRNFTMIGGVKASANSSVNNYYSYNDKQPSKAINYYRLKIVDKDGRFEYSETRPVNNLGGLEAVIKSNPAKDGLLKVRLSADKSAIVELSILGVDGKILTNQKINVNAGITDKSINISSIDNGVYFIRIQSSNQKIGLKFVKAQ